MQLVQKPSAKSRSKLKIAILVALFLSCKPYFFSTGFDLSFDLKTAVNRIQRAGVWVANQVATQFQDSQRNVNRGRSQEATK
jgi:hypothetical protein